ncbi:MAG: hypothetical protein ACYDEV_12775 [Acidiferrobacter sp.]
MASVRGARGSARERALPTILILSLATDHKEDFPEVRKQIKNYEKMKLLADRWIDLATELSNLRIAKEKAKITAKT